MGRQVGPSSGKEQGTVMGMGLEEVGLGRQQLSKPCWERPCHMPPQLL